MNRKTAWNLTVFIFACQLVFLMDAVSAEKLRIEHPLKHPQRYTDKARCDNCGMDRNAWARTRYEFRTSKGTFFTCSLQCTAVMGMKLGEEPHDVKVAEYLHPEKMLDADKAFFVVGSSAPGTMTRRSKIAFSSRKEAKKFAARYGGAVTDFHGALSEARAEVRGH